MIEPAGRGSGRGLGRFAVAVAIAAACAGDRAPMDERDDEAARVRWQLRTFGPPLSADALEQRARLVEREARREQANRARLAAARASPTALQLAATAPPVWTNLGPTSADPATGVVDSGRVVAIVPHPTDPNTLYVAAAGGVFKCTNADLAATGDWTWTPLTDGLPLSSAAGNLAVGALAMSPVDPQTLYLGLGDRADPYGQVRGFFVTHDGGATWTPGSGITATITLRILPLDANVVLVGTASGLWRSTDGAQSFNPVPLPAFPVDSGSSTLVYSLIRFDDGTVALARTNSLDGDILLSSDQGATWRAASIAPTGYRYARIELAAGPGGAAWAVAQPTTGPAPVIPLRSLDHGATWTWVPDSKNAIDSSQLGYNQTLAVDPDDASHVFIGTRPLARSLDGGQSWVSLNSSGSLHPDLHVLAWSRAGPKTLFVGGDGGLTIVHDPLQSPMPQATLPPNPSFLDSRRNAGLPTFLVFNLGSTQAAGGENTVTIGTQDDGARVRLAGGRFDLASNGDGFATVVHAVKPAWMLFSINGLVLQSTDAGKTTRIAPTIPDAQFGVRLFADPADPSGNGVYLVGDRHLYRSADFGWTFTALGTQGLDPSFGILAAAATKADPKTLALLGPGRGYRSTDGGATWTAMDVANLQIPFPRAIWLGTRDPKTVLIASSFFDVTRHHLFRSRDAGQTWETLDGALGASNGFPFGAPVLAVQDDPVRAGTLWASTDLGLYRSDDDGATWQRFGAGLPMISVPDFWLAPDGSLVRAATYGRGVWEARLDAGPPPGPVALSISPAALAVAAGGTASFAVSASQPPGAPSTPFALSVSGLPAGVAASFAPAAIAPGGAATLTMTAAANAPASTAQLTVAGGGASAQASLSVTAAPGDDFSLSVAPASAVVPAGGTAVMHVATQLVSGGAQTIALSIDGLPAGVSASFSLAQVTAGGGALLTLSAAANAAAASASSSVRGSSASAAHAAPLAVTVTAASPPPPPPPSPGPSAAVTEPAPGATLTGAVHLAASASAPGGLARLELLVDGAVVAASGSSPLETAWDTSAVSPGPHTISAAATDQQGQRAESAKVSIVVAAEAVAPLPPTKIRGGGCSSTGGGVDGAFALLALALLARKRSGDTIRNSA